MVISGLSCDTGWRDDIQRAANGLRDHIGGAGDALAARLRSGALIGPGERELLALLVTDRLLSDREDDGRPLGELHPWHVQAAAAVEFLDRKPTVPHGHATRLRAEIAARHGVGPDLVKRWTTEYRKTVAKLDAQMHDRAERIVDERIARLERQGQRCRADVVRSRRERCVDKAAARLDRLGYGGDAIMRRNIRDTAK